MSNYTETVTDDTLPTIALDAGAVIYERWKVTKMLGEGGCGSVYEVQHKDGKRIAALKVERRQKDKEDEVLRMEVRVLKKLRGHDHLCHLYDYGKTSEYSFMIITKVGHDLQELRRACPDQHFTTSTTVRLMLQCLQALRTLHDIGYVHRDIKPANFALGVQSACQTVYLLDFGLARQFVVISGAGDKIIREPRSDVGFRGTPRYCSINVHRRLEQGRHDDLWSMLYMAVEMIRGQLPWRNKEKHDAQQIKAEISDRELLRKCPQEFFFIVSHLKQLNYMTKPDYSMIDSSLQKIISRKKYELKAPFDWEQGGRFYESFKNKTDQDFKDLESIEDDEDGTATEPPQKRPRTPAPVATR